MSKEYELENVFLEIGFRSPEKEGSLKTIQLFGIPGDKLRNNTYVVGEKTKSFFDDLIVRPIFRDSRRLHNCKFEHLKIWLYDTNVRNEERGYKIPKIDNRDLDIHSNFSSSQLEHIYILDNELSGNEYKIWERNAEDIFTPLFKQFIVPPEPPSIFKNSPFIKFMEEVTDKVDPYFKMKQKVIFNALIIQID